MSLMNMTNSPPLINLALNCLLQLGVITYWVDIGEVMLEHTVLTRWRYTQAARVEDMEGHLARVLRTWVNVLTLNHVQGLKCSS